MRAELQLESRAPRSVPPALRAVLVLFFLYLFLAGIAFLEAGIASLGEGFQAGLLQSVSHPLSGLCAGVLATVLVQSSSVTTATIVGMVGAGTLPLALAVPMIMGANVGTTVTSTIASLGSIRRAGEFRKAFAAASVHDFFNLMGVAILLPIELATGVLQSTATLLSDLLRGRDVGAAAAPSSSALREMVRVPVDAVLGVVPAGPVVPVVMLAVGLFLIFVALTMITRNMRRLVAGGVERAVNSLIGRGGGVLGILVGIGVTVAVQSSSITTSILVPLVASGILGLPGAFSITVGANIGTTITALLASLAVARPEGLTIALVHTLFNVSATLIIFPIERVRLIPVRLAEALGDLASRRRPIALSYGVVFFILLPLLGLFLVQ